MIMNTYFVHLNWVVGTQPGDNRSDDGFRCYGTDEVLEQCAKFYGCDRSVSVRDADAPGGARHICTLPAYASVDRLQRSIGV
jgi:hypothetical protein